MVSLQRDAHHRLKFIFLYIIIVVLFDKSTGVNDTKQDKIMAGLWGMKIAKTIRSKIKQAVKRSSFSFTINGTVFVPDKRSLNISEPERSCATGQAYRDGVCGKIFN